MGRKSVAEERREEILDAFERCVARYGLEGSSLEQIADEAGMKRSILRHYIGNRDALVDALIERATKTYLEQIEQEFAHVPVEAMIGTILDALFVADPKPDVNDRIVVDVLMTAHDRYPRAKELLRSMFNELVALFAEELQRAYPRATAEQCHGVAYTIWCISTTNDSLAWLGMPQEYRRAARAHAEALVRSLVSTNDGRPTTNAERKT